MELIRDYLGSDYAIIVAYFLFILWFVVIAVIQNKRKEKNFKSFRKLWWFWTVTGILIVNVFFTQFNSTFFGFSTPNSFTELIVRDNEIILFNNEVTYYDDDNTSTEDYSSHLRIHVVDRTSHEKKYEDLIGTNYFTLVDMNEIFILSYTGYSTGYLSEVYTYNTSNQEMSSLVSLDGTISCEGKSIEVYELEATLGVVVTSKLGEQFIYNSTTGLFEVFEGKYPNLRPDQKFSNDFPFQLVAEQNSTDRQILTIGTDKTTNTFISGEIVKEISNNKESFALIKSYEDLTKETVLYDFFDQNGNRLWRLHLYDLEEKVGSSGFEEIQQVKLDEEYLYITINAYLFELSLRTGAVNWWLKL